PPTNHVQNGGLVVSSVMSQGLYQSRRSAYSLKQSGKLSRPNRSRTDLSVRLAWVTNFSGGLTQSSSCQWTAISASDTPAVLSCDMLCLRNVVLRINRASVVRRVLCFACL